MKTLEIKKGWFWSAGDRFNWKSKGYDRSGVGIDTRLLMTNQELKVFVSDKAYILNCDEAKKFVREFSSLETRSGIRLAIISKTLFKPFHEESLHTQ